MLSGDGTLFHDPSTKRWLRFSQAREILIAHSAEEVVPTLQRVEELVESEKCFAVGFVSYEGASAFDPVYCVKADAEFPLAWFGLCEKPEVISGPAREASSSDGLRWQFPVTSEEYRAAVERIRGYIRTGDTYQVNYTVRLTGPAPESASALFAAMVAAQGAQYAAFIDTERFCICSTSPELFFRLDGEELICRPMKGTAARGLWSAQDRQQPTQTLLSEKNRAENLMIVDMVRNDMGRVAETGTVAVRNIFQAEKYPTIWQMTSTVRCETTNSIPELFRGLFPAASITGAPKVRTMQLIAELEKTPRRIYTGAIGFIGPGRRAQFNVAIRTVLIDKRTRRAEYGVGGGIVWDSVPEQELEECRTKAKILARPPPEFALLETMLWTPREGFSLLEEHLRRLGESADYFSMPLGLAEVGDRLAELTSRLPAVPHRVRLLVAQSGKIALEAHQLAPLPHPYRVALAKTPVDAQDVFLYHKTTHREVYEQAMVGRPGWDDVLLWNERRELTESTIANLVVEKRGALLTPPLECGVLPGVYRARMLQQKRVQEEIIRLEDLASCTRVYLANSVRGMWEVIARAVKD